MAHSLANLEYHHFKYANHRVPGQAHVHFYGADAFSFGEDVRLQDGDRMEVRWTAWDVRSAIRYGKVRLIPVSLGCRRCNGTLTESSTTTSRELGAGNGSVF